MPQTWGQVVCEEQAMSQLSQFLRDFLTFERSVGTQISPNKSKCKLNF